MTDTAAKDSRQATADLRLTDVSHAYRSHGREVLALTGVNLHIQEGEFIALVGPSGCGKTTLLQIIAGFMEPSAGTVELDGRQITGPGAERGVVFQQPNLFPWLSVHANVTFGPRVRGMKREGYNPRADHYLKLVGLAEFSDRPPYELSGGMQQRAAIARVLTNDPKIMLMDEPFGALDALTRERMQEELLRIWRETDKTVFFITHGVEEAVYLATRVLVMTPRPGRIVLDEEVPFSRQAGKGKAIRASTEFIQIREKVKGIIYDQTPAEIQTHSTEQTGT